MTHGMLVVGLFGNAADANRAVVSLETAGFGANDLSLVGAGDDVAAKMGITAHTHVGEGAAIGAGVMGALGAAAAGFAAVGAIATGGAGVIIAGPLVAALAGAGAGAAAGGIIGGLVGLGIPEHEVQVWREEMRKGAVLLGVRCHPEQAARVKKILESEGAHRIVTQEVDLRTLSSAEAAASAPASAARTRSNGKDLPGDEWGKVSPLHGLFADQLRDIYYAEHKLLDALRVLESKATTGDLASAFRSHREETQGQIVRLEDVFAITGIRPEQKTCPAINGILAETRELFGVHGEPEQRDAAIICAAQKAEHYEIGTYGCLRTYARTLGFERAAELLDMNLEEEHQADRTLTSLAEAGINRLAGAR